MIYFSPETPFNALRIAQIALAKQEVYGHAYSFSLAALTDLIILQARKGVKHHWIFDKSQYLSTYNPAMKTNVDRLLNVMGVDVIIGSVHGLEIAHDKFVVIDGTRVQYGSANYTRDAERQTNHVVLEVNKTLSAKFIKHWKAIKKVVK